MTDTEDKPSNNNSDDNDLLSCVESADSEDELPLFSRFRHGANGKTVSAKSNISEKLKELRSELLEDDSDDEKPLSFRIKSSCTDAGASGFMRRISENLEIKGSELLEDDSDEEKPLSTRVRQNTDGREVVSDRSKILQDKQLKSGKQIRIESGVSKKRPASDRTFSKGSVENAKVLNGSVPSISAKKPRLAKGDVSDDDNSSNGAVARASRGVKKRQPKQKAKGEMNKKSKKANKGTQYAVSLKEPPKSGQEKRWTTLEHNGVWFPPPYTPHGVKMLYDGKPVDLTPKQEEVATMYAGKLDTDYVKIPTYNQNFFDDWRDILGKKHVIKDLKKCDFTPIHQWIKRKQEKKKQVTPEEKAAIKARKSEVEDKYMWAIVDGVREKVGTFRVEPPDLFKGRGDHPKIGRLKRRILPSEITLNIGKEAPVPECPVPGERWKEVIHDNTVTWLARWDDPIKPNHGKYVFLAPSSNLKGQKDKEKYEKARELKNHIDRIRASYTKDFKSKDVMKKQTAVAIYLIDRLALRAGNEKDDDEAATVGCCTLKVENVKPIPPNTLELDFLGKDSIRFCKKFEAELLVFKAIVQFRKGKNDQDPLFDKLDTAKLNAHLKDFMPGLTAKVFRTYHASITLDVLLNKEAGNGDVSQKVEFHRKANKEVAILCNHQRSPPKSHDAQMEKQTEKIEEFKRALSELKKELNQSRKGNSQAKKRKSTTEAIEKKIAKVNERIRRVEHEMVSKEDMKTIALGTSKTNYLDPRITVSWCKRNEVPIEKIFSKTDQAKFIWAMDVAPNFRF